LRTIIDLVVSHIHIQDMNINFGVVTILLASLA